MAVRKIAHPSVDDRKAKGLEARDRAPLSGHTKWSPAADRPDPVALLEEQDTTREQDLVPVRHGRMMVSPFTFYRGAAKIMAADLTETPVAGLDAQLCGDAHLSNFGVFASPERVLLFDVNDFDETLPGPFEYDVKRMAASFEIAARNNGFSQADARSGDAGVGAGLPGGDGRLRADGHDGHLVRPPGRGRAQGRDPQRGGRGGEAGERAAKQEKADKRAKAPKKAEKRAAKQEKADREEETAAKTAEKRADKTLAKAHTRDSLQALSKLCEQVDGTYRIVSQPPIVVPARDLAATYGLSPDQVVPAIHEQFRAYRATLRDDRAAPAGKRSRSWTRPARSSAWAASGRGRSSSCCQGRDADDPLFLQIKEATASVLEAHLGKSRYRQHGERVVRGQRMMQAASDIFLGWTKGVDVNRHFYWRQLRDMKGSADVEAMIPLGLTYYARICGWTLARAHARSGDPVAIAEYLGETDAFDKSITDFSERYADQNEKDYEEFVDAVRSGRIEAREGV